MALNYRRFLISPNEEGLNLAANLLKSGQLVAFPTETVYGLGADATNVEAVLSIFKAKGRPLTDPLIVHIASPIDAEPLVELQLEEHKVFYALSEKFWPGPLTQIVKASSKIPPQVTANTGYVGIRCPKHKLALALLQYSQLPIAAPSANRFGHVSPTRAEHVLTDLAEKGVMVLDGEHPEYIYDTPCEFGIESTVVKLDGQTKELIVFRQGAVTQEQLQSLLHEAHLEDWKIKVVVRTVKMHAVEKTNPTTQQKSEPMSTPHVESIGTSLEGVIEAGQVAPGQAVTHYAPDVPCFLLQQLTTSSNLSEQVEESRNIAEDLCITPEQLKEKVVLIDFHQQYHIYADQVLAYRDLASTGDMRDAARELFTTLRWSEQIAGAEYVLIAPVLSSETIPENEYGLALGVADRIFRAASGMKKSVIIA
jgi:L-threonylcarbamoyladenylate synthase